MIIAIIPIIILSLYIYDNNINNITERYRDERLKSMESNANEIERRADWVLSVMTNLIVSDDIIDLLKKSEKDAKIYDESYLEALDSISSSYLSSTIDQYISMIMILGENGLVIRNGQSAGLIQQNIIEESEWYKNGKKSGALVWGEYSEGYYLVLKNQYRIPVYWSIPDDITPNSIGECIMLLNPVIFLNLFDHSTQSEVYFMKPDGTIVLTNQLNENGSMKKISEPVSHSLRGILEKNIDTHSLNQNIVEIEDKQWLATSTHIPFRDWILVEYYPLTEVESQTRSFIFALGAIITLLILASVGMSVFLSNTLTKPIRRIINHVEEIGKGNFDHIEVTEGGTELNTLLRTVNDMQSSIVLLIESNVAKEKEKGQMEMQMLRNQINPHFLYNTLNSIKIMATMQGADGITKMIKSLANILQYTLRSADEKTLVSEELKVIEDYLHIQYIRYKGNIIFEKEIADDQLLECIVPRFIIQPIMENSIQHGLLKVERMGKIILRIFEENSKLIIEVEDNGAGMDKGQLLAIRKKLNNRFDYHSTKGKSIGIINVHRRICLMYGPSYGVSIDSELNHYTRIKISLKMEK